MNIYISYANAYTSLGYGNKLWDSIIEGKCGLTSIHDIYPNVVDKYIDPHISVFKEIDAYNGRLQKIFDLAHKNIIPEEAKKCDLIIGASSLGDLYGNNEGVPSVELKEYLYKYSFPKNLIESSFVVSSACSSGTDAVSIATLLIKSGVVDSIGILAFDSLEYGKVMQHISLATQSNYKAKPFDINRNGTSFAEGIAFVIVANENGINRLKHSPLVEIIGIGSSCDAFHITTPEPSGKWQSQAIQQALSSVDDYSTIDYINAHGTGTIYNDIVEAKILNQTFKNINEIIISSTKGSLGHSLGATGLIEAVLTIWSIKNKVCPGTVGLDELDSSLKIDILKKSKYNYPIDIAMSINFGFGGTNSAIIFQDFI